MAPQTRPSTTQPTLFAKPIQIPTLDALDPKTRHDLVKLIARMLRDHVEQHEQKEGDDE